MKFLVTLLFASIARVSSSPARRSGPQTLSNSEIYDNIKHYSMYSAASYCYADYPSGTAIECDYDSCPALQQNNVTITAPFRGALGSLVGLIATDHTRREIVVVFRGSASLGNFIYDLNVLQTDCHYAPGCKVHWGFLAAWNEVKSQVKSLALEAKQRDPDYQIVFTGHSLGGAVAQLAALELRLDGGPFEGAPQYNYGSPRVGNYVFVRYLMQQDAPDFRVTHYNDFATVFPPVSLGFNHPYPEYWLWSWPSTRTDYSMGDIQVCTGTWQFQCSSWIPISLNVNAHMYYFRNLWSCYRYTLKRSAAEGNEFDDSVLARLSHGNENIQKLKYWGQLDLELRNKTMWELR